MNIEYMNIELLKEAIAIIEKVPDNKLWLRLWQSQNQDTAYVIARVPEDVTCDTMACAAGWISLDPGMQKRGLKAGHWEGMPEYTDPTTQHSWNSFEALSVFFGLTLTQARHLFCQRGMYDPLENCDLATDRELWLKRARNLLEQGEE